MDLINMPRELDTDDLHLRPLKMSDAEGMYDILSDNQSMKYWSNKPVADIEEAKQFLREDLDSDADGNSLCWAVTLKGQDQLIGKCILFNFSPKNYRAEIGYILNRKYWRRGLMQQAIEALIHFAFNDLKLHRLEADTDTENTSSMALLEKLGFKREGLFRERWYVYDEWADSVMYGLLNSDQ
jgi:RimJ/RimL family protein N-acetyltransferase